MTRVAVIDDWQEVAETIADWSPVTAVADLEFFHQNFQSEDEAAVALADFDIIVAMRERTLFPVSLLERLPRLKMLSVTGRRARALDIPVIVERGITVCLTGGGEGGEDTAEHTLGLILATARGIALGDVSVKSGHFQQGVVPGVRLKGKTLGIVGLGLIGSHMARYGATLGMDIVAWSNNLTAERAQAVGVRAVSKEELFSSADVITVHLVLAPSTRGIVGESEIAMMKQGAILVNTSRAGLIDEAALVSALHAKKIFTATDVFEHEPPAADHPLRTTPNTVLTPHLGYGTRETYGLFFENSVENVMAYLDGQPIREFQE